MARREEVGITITADDKASPAIKKTGASLADLGDSAAKSSGSLGSVMSVIGTGMGIGAGMAIFERATDVIVGGFTAAVNAASDLNEQVNRVSVVFGAAAPRIQAFASTATTAMGMSSRAALQASGDFGNFFNALGIAKPKAADMSMAMVKLAGDLSSFHNIPIADALEKIRAGLAGEAEPLRQLGVNLTEATIRQQAMSMGLTVTAGTLDGATRAQAAYALILEQTKNAQGDYANTSDSLANSQRRLQADLEDLSATLGTTFLPMIAEAVSGLDNWAWALNRLAGAANDAGDSTSFLDQVIGGLLGPLGPAIAGTNDLTAKLRAEEEAARAVAAATGDEQAATQIAIAATIAAAGNTEVYTGALGRLASAAQVARDRLAALNGTMGSVTTAQQVNSQSGFVMGQSYAQIQKSTNDAVLAQRAWIATQRQATTAMGASSSAVDTLRQKVQTQLTQAYDALRSKAIAALDAIHAKKIRAIDDAMKLRQAEYDAYVAATQGPVDAARAALEEERAKRDLADAQQELNAAYAEGDAQAIAAAQRRVDDLKADQKIAQMQKEADAAIAAEKAKKDAADNADEAAKAKATADYEKAKEKLEAQIKWLEGHLDKVDATYKKRFADLIGNLKKYGLDFETIGKTMGEKYASGVVTGLDKLIASIAKKVAKLLAEEGGSGGPTPPGRASGGPVWANRVYKVGEKGEEWFVPDQNGTIIPNGGVVGTAEKPGGGVIGTAEQPGRDGNYFAMENARRRFFGERYGLSLFDDSRIPAFSAAGGLSVGSITVNVSSKGGFDGASAARDFYDQLDQEGRRRGYVGIGRRP